MTATKPRRGPLPAIERPCERCAVTRLALRHARRRLAASVSHIARLERMIAENFGVRAVPARPHAMEQQEPTQ